MLSILVGHSYFLHLDSKQLERAKPYPPLAMLQVAALLRESGHAVSLFDAMLADGVADFAAHLRAAQVVVLQEDNFNFLSKIVSGRGARGVLRDDRTGRGRRYSHAGSSRQQYLAGNDGMIASATRASPV